MQKPVLKDAPVAAPLKPAALEAEDSLPDDPGAPPPPEPFPYGWEENSLPEVAYPPAIPQAAPTLIAAGEGEQRDAPEEEQGSKRELRPPRGDLGEVGLDPPLAGSLTEPPLPPPADEPETPLPGYLVAPISGTASESVQMITVVMRSSGDKTRDVLRVRRIYGLVMSYPGNDRFAFHVFERGQGYLMEFPNFTTGYCSELVVKLQQVVGVENIRIEKITFQ